MTDDFPPNLLDIGEPPGLIDAKMQQTKSVSMLLMAAYMLVTDAESEPMLRASAEVSMSMAATRGTRS